eukprot:6128334-Pleurochrysis_carterae.AAC.1
MMRPASLGSTALHATFARLTLLRPRRLCAAVLSSPCRSPAPCVFDSIPSLDSRSRRAACKDGSSRLQGPRPTQQTKEVRSPQTSPPRVEPPPPPWDTHFSLTLMRVLSAHAFDC